MLLPDLSHHSSAILKKRGFLSLQIGSTEQTKMSPHKNHGYVCADYAGGQMLREMGVRDREGEMWLCVENAFYITFVCS